MPYTQDVKTLTGYTIAEAIGKLDEELPPEAYKSVPGGADLTDIDPNHMRRVLNDVFGLAGYGWGYKYDPDHVYSRVEEHNTKSGKRTRVVAVVKHLEFWYRLMVDGKPYTGVIPATGASKNSEDAYALKGALTNAIGNAVSNIGFQLSVYLGKRTHRTVRKSGGAVRKPAPRKAAPPKAAPKTAPKTASAVADDVDDLDDLDDAPAKSSWGDYVIPLGKNKGKKLSQVSRRAVEWYANEMSPHTDLGEELQEAAKAYLEELA